MIGLKLRALGAILLSLLLVETQVGALAHLIGHLGGTGHWQVSAWQTAAHGSQGDGQDEDSSSPDHPCAICISLGALAGFASSSAQSFSALGAFARASLPLSSPILAGHSATYQARAPPFFL
jgi:hypothetical protein